MNLDEINLGRIGDTVRSICDASDYRSPDDIDPEKYEHRELQLYMQASSARFNVITKQFEAIGLEARIQEFDHRQLTARNGCFALPGTDPTIFFVSHHDYRGPGVNDNASGGAAMIEAARALRGTEFANHVGFYSCDLEEVGPVGSKRLVSQLSKEERERVKAVIAVDTVGSFGDICFWRNARHIASNSHLLALLQKAAEETGRKGIIADNTDFTSDHAPFLKKCIPAAAIVTGRCGPYVDSCSKRPGMCWVPPPIHTAEDNFENLNTHQMLSVARVLAVFPEVLLKSQKKEVHCA